MDIWGVGDFWPEFWDWEVVEELTGTVGAVGEIPGTVGIRGLKPKVLAVVGIQTETERK